MHRNSKCCILISWRLCLKIYNWYKLIDHYMYLFHLGREAVWRNLWYHRQRGRWQWQLRGRCFILKWSFTRFHIKVRACTTFYIELRVFIIYLNLGIESHFVGVHGPYELHRKEKQIKCNSILIFTSFNNKVCCNIAYFNTKMSHLSDFKRTKSKTLRTAKQTEDELKKSAVWSSANNTNKKIDILNVWLS